MISSFLPTVFRLLALNPNRAIDDAVARALGSLDDSTQEAACQLLLRRGHQASLTSVIANYRGYGDHLKSLLAANAEVLRPVLLELLQSSRTGHSMAAVDLVCACGDPRCVDLLGEGLYAPDREARAAAARGLRRAVESRLDQSPRTAAAPMRSSQTTGNPTKKCADPDQRLIATLSTAVRRWENHELTPALEAALWMSDRMHGVFHEKLSEPRTTITRALILRLQAASDPRAAGFMVRALAIPALRAAAVRGIASAEDPKLRESVLNHSWLLFDPEVARGARMLRALPWLEKYLEERDAQPPALITTALRWLDACGAAPESRTESLRRVLDGAMPDERRDAFWLLCRDGKDSATAVLGAVAERHGDPLARAAGRAMRRLRRTPTAMPSVLPGQLDGRRAAPPRSLAEQYWHSAHLAESEAHAFHSAKPPPGDWLVFLRGKLASSDPADRSRALTLIHKDGLLSPLQEQVLRLAHDPDGGVRAKAVHMLPALSTTTAGRVARTATHDPDPRVQANAVEALDRMDQPDRAAVTLPRLESAYPRVRANAVKSLLKLELARAAEELLAMLEDSSAAHRLSGLWVIEQLELRSLSGRLTELGADDPSPAVRRKCARLLRKFTAAPHRREFDANTLTPGLES